MAFLSYIKPIHIALLLLSIAFIIQVYFYSRYYFAVIRENRKRKKHPITSETLPPVSVVICAKDEAVNLKNFLPTILEQDYPEFEVIVVNDGNTAPTQEILATLKGQYPNLIETFVPANARVISRKKLALTVGIKAAKNEWILLTDADCQVVSPNWIREMAKHFTDGTEVVLGYGAYAQEKNFLSRLISYDTLFIALQYMGYTLGGHPYMGVGRNMAYRRSTFFQRNGFADILHIQSGDDDLYVSAIATRTNTRIEFTPDSKTVSIPKQNFREWIQQRERHLSTSTNYKRETLNRIAWEVTSRGLFYAALIACLCYWNLLYSLIAIGLLLIRYTLQCCAINISAKIMGERHFAISIPLFDIIIPLLNLYMMLSNTLHRRRRFTWK